MRVPVLFLGFNRPDLAVRVLERLRDCGVQQLYVALDAPRPNNPGDRDLCRSMKSLIDALDWADVKCVLERDHNLGCGLAVSSAISWFFEHVNQGIIVEDDCLPDPTFFPFCEEMLKKYEDDPRVWSVAGTSLIPEGLEIRGSHFFSALSNIWGWATWKRAWQTYDYGLASLSAGEWESLIRERCANAVELRYWLHILELMLKSEIDTWDYQVQFSAWKENGLHLTSSHNLVENLGFRGDATHTRQSSSLSGLTVKRNLPPYADLPVVADEALDRIMFGERLHASPMLAEWLFGNDTLDRLSKTATQQLDYIKELQDHLEKRSAVIAELDTARKQSLETIGRLQTELARYSGFSGALRCLGRKTG